MFALVLRLFVLAFWGAIVGAVEWVKLSRKGSVVRPAAALAFCRCGGIAAPRTLLPGGRRILCLWDTPESRPQRPGTLSAVSVEGFSPEALAVPVCREDLETFTSLKELLSDEGVIIGGRSSLSLAFFPTRDRAWPANAEALGKVGGEASVEFRRGLQALSPFPRGASICWVPYGAFLTTRSLGVAEDKADGFQADSEGEKWEAPLRLAAALLPLLKARREKGSAHALTESAFRFSALQRRYAELLPPIPLSFALNWSTAACHSAGIALRNKICGRNKILREFLLREGRSGGEADPERELSQLREAFFYVRSRAVLFRRTAESRSSLALVPLLDLCNHSDVPNAALRRTRRPPVCSAVASKSSSGSSLSEPAQVEGLELVALRDIRAGEEVTVTYGALNNFTLLLEFGMLPERNR